MLYNYVIIYIYEIWMHTYDVDMKCSIYRPIHWVPLESEFMHLAVDKPKARGHVSSPVMQSDEAWHIQLATTNLD